MAGEAHIGAKLRQLAQSHPERTAIIDDAGAWSFRQFNARVARFGNALRGLGLEKGDRVALLIPDLREYLEADYGTMAAGLVRVPIDPRVTRQELVGLLRHAGARALVTHASFAATVQGLSDEVECLAHVIGIGAGVGRLGYEALLEGASERPLPDGDGEDLATLNFSGGTTGSPKAIMLRHRNLMAVADHTILGFDIGGDARFLNVRPLWPIAQVILMSHLFAGATVILGGRFDPPSFADRVAATGTTRTSLVPTQLVRWIDHLRAGDPRLARLQAIYVGGSRIPPPVLERALAALGPRIGVLYGLTEAPISCYLPPRDLDEKAQRQRELIGSVGRALPGCEIRIATSDREGGLSTGEAGEVLIRGGNVMAGYWEQEAATGAVLRDGWLHTGDIGRVDAAGNLSIVARLKEVIRSGSSSVIPKEVEDVIALHPAVAEVAVVGLPDLEWGEAVTAFVVLRPGAAASERDLVEHCRGHLASYKKPRAVRFVASLPRSHYGKVIRAELIAQAAS
jgi:acyl-CoA synthetase (AMP-forming)/AMP-acid ligase II